MAKLKITVKPGEWYLGVVCKACGKAFPMFHDPSKGKISFQGPGKLKAACPHCAQIRTYAATAVRSFEAHQVH